MFGWGHFYCEGCISRVTVIFVQSTVGGAGASEPMDIQALVGASVSSANRAPCIARSTSSSSNVGGGGADDDDDMGPVSTSASRRRQRHRSGEMDGATTTTTTNLDPSSSTRTSSSQEDDYLKTPSSAGSGESILTAIRAPSASTLKVGHDKLSSTHSPSLSSSAASGSLSRYI